MPLKVYIDGKLYDKEDAKVSVYDHGLLYGDGVFEGIRAYAGHVFEMEDHLTRLYDSAKSIRLQIPIDRDEMRRAIEEVVKVNNFTDCYLRVVVTRGVGDLGLDPRRSIKPSVIIIADKLNVYPPEMYANGMSIVTAGTIRNHPMALSPRIKSLNYLNNILAKIEANDAGVPEALMLNHLGNVAECTADNVFVVRWGRVFTPSVDQGILDGITRRAIINLCKTLGIDLIEGPLQKHDIYIADEFFVTGTGAEVMPVTKIDGRTIGDGAVGPITKKLIAAYHQLVRTAPSEKQ